LIDVRFAKFKHFLQTKAPIMSLANGQHDTKQMKLPYHHSQCEIGKHNNHDNTCTIANANQHEQNDECMA